MGDSFSRCDDDTMVTTDVLVLKTCRLKYLGVKYCDDCGLARGTAKIFLKKENKVNVNHC